MYYCTSQARFRIYIPLCYNQGWFRTTGSECREGYDFSYEHRISYRTWSGVQEFRKLPFVSFYAFIIIITIFYSKIFSGIESVLFCLFFVVVGFFFFGGVATRVTVGNSISHKWFIAKYLHIMQSSRGLLTLHMWHVNMLLEWKQTHSAPMKNTARWRSRAYLEMPQRS